MKERPNQSEATPHGAHLNPQGGPERLEDAAERARVATIEKVENVRDRAREGIDQGRQAMVERIRRVGSALRSASEQLNDEDEVAARYAASASRTAERAAGYIGSTDMKRVVRDVEGFARREPALFFGGAFLLGLAAGRFLRSSQNGNGEPDELERDFAERDTLTQWPRPQPRPGSVTQQRQSR
jgi:hypothetical protein